MGEYVLVIEDQESIAELEKRYLEKAGFRVKTASTAQEGLEIIGGEEPPDLLIIDYRLPDISGIEILKKIKEMGKNIPSVIVTGGGDEEVAVTAMKLGALDYIVKDTESVKHLANTCSEVLKRFNLEEENRRLMEELKKANADLTTINRKLDDLSKMDDLTKIYNRRYLLETLNYEIARSYRYEQPLSFAIFDLDHFKQVNDTYGHTVGDTVLKQYADLLEGRLRKTDVLGRYGGEEFGIILTGTTLENAITTCNTLRELVAGSTFGNDEHRIQLTTSAGVAFLVEQMDRKKLIDIADKSLYRAKESGRNRIISVQKEGEVSP